MRPYHSPNREKELYGIKTFERANFAQIDGASDTTNDSPLCIYYFVTILDLFKNKDQSYLY